MSASRRRPSRHSLRAKVLYICPELTHFVGRKLTPDRDKQFELLLTIVSSGILSSYPGHAGHNWANYAYTQPLQYRNGEFSGLARACFCDIPPEDFAIHVSKYGEFGLAFPKPFL